MKGRKATVSSTGKSLAALVEFSITYICVPPKRALADSLSGMDDDDDETISSLQHMKSCALGLCVLARVPCNSSNNNLLTHTYTLHYIDFSLVSDNGFGTGKSAAAEHPDPITSIGAKRSQSVVRSRRQ